MMDQLCMDTMVPDEQKAFEVLYPEIQDLLLDAPMESGILSFHLNQDGTGSVTFLNTSEVFVNIRLQKEKHYFRVSTEHEDLLTPDIPTATTKTDRNSGFLRIPIDTYTDILKYVPLLRAVLARICRKNRDFGCCSRYIECSDAKACVHPNPEFAIRCWYRTNLDDGKIFYGKNKTSTERNEVET